MAMAGGGQGVLTGLAVLFAVSQLVDLASGFTVSFGVWLQMDDSNQPAQVFMYLCAHDGSKSRRDGRSLAQKQRTLIPGDQCQRTKSKLLDSKEVFLSLLT